MKKQRNVTGEYFYTYEIKFLGIEVMLASEYVFDYAGANLILNRMSNNWRIPTINELKFLNTLKHAGDIGGFPTGLYLSSTVDTRFDSSHFTFSMNTKGIDCTLSHQDIYGGIIKLVRNLQNS